MSTLNPQQAANIATGVYRIMNRSISDLRERGGVLGCEGMFAVDDASRFSGKTGGMMVWKEITGFGYIAEGEGKYKGEILIVTRGTQSKPDWLSNLNIGVQNGPGGFLVHAGFNEVWKSYSEDIKTFLRNRNPTVVHCVGHSLGGALATLNADLLSAAQVAQVKLYTFGSPHTGVSMFSTSLTGRLGVDNIFRVYHASDPVPMIPVFPFQHVPFASRSYALRVGGYGLVSVDAHLMPSYTSAVANLDWSGLAAGDEPEMGESKLVAWLDQVATGVGPAIVGRVYALKLIGRVLNWILKKSGSLVIGACGIALTAHFTLLDRLAWLLQRGAQVSIELAGQIENLIVAIFRFLGRPIVKGMALTVAFIGWVLDLLFQSVQRVALCALAQAAPR